MFKIHQLLIKIMLFGVLSMNSNIVLATSETHNISHSKTNESGIAHAKKSPAKKPHAAKYKTKKHGNNMIGVASFYGFDFHGQQMANGEYFNSHDSTTAAHKFLPLGTKLRVTNLSNGRAIYVEVRDRMGHSKRIIDVSQAAAKLLGMHRKGLTRVELTKVSDDEFYEKKHCLIIDPNDDGRLY